ncbi:MAG TPA: TraR/DksA C4-type zinc finger protein [Hyphomicrobiales bacterium]|nr:TraR/DksA C4-type zinc finger protein [Hyphomicrobiales bacterium]
MADHADIAGEYIDRATAAQIENVRRRLGKVESTTLVRECLECGELIPAARLAAMPGARRCVYCQSTSERRGLEG